MSEHGGLLFEAAEAYGWIRCRVCRVEMRNGALTRAAHGKMHLRRGEATTEVDLTSDHGPRTIYRLP